MAALNALQIKPGSCPNAILLMSQSFPVDDAFLRSRSLFQRRFCLQFITGSFYTVFAELRYTLRARESDSLLPRAVAPGAFLYLWLR
jgi:hypothetical protein